MAETNLREFTLGVGKFAERADKLWREKSRAVALRALAGVVLGTRVDTGRARGNWQVAEGTPPEGHDPDMKDPNGAATIAKGARVIGESLKGEPDVIWLHNGVPYINVLEDMDKMVQGNVEALRTWLDSQ